MNFLVVTRNFIVITRKFLGIPTKFLVITRNFLGITRNFLVITRKILGKLVGDSTVLQAQRPGRRRIVSQGSDPLMLLYGLFNRFGHSAKPYC